ncbi:DUF5719 family protein [Brachybacterium sp. 107]|uniref:DUF5719 family protein n=1 Tax=Brachybacterium sp. 107 TaxID=3457736 RepID=UPI004033BC2C
MADHDPRRDHDSQHPPAPEGGPMSGGTSSGGTSSGGTSGGGPDEQGQEHPPLSRRERHGPVRPVLALAALLPLAAAIGVIVTAPTPEPTQVTHAQSQSQPGASTLQCPGPLEVPDQLLVETADQDLSVTPPSATVGLSSVALEQDSSVLFGRVSGSETLQDENGEVRAPSLATEAADGSALSEDTASADLGVGIQIIPEVDGASVVRAATSEGGRPVTDSVQSTATTSGDYRSLALTRCGAPRTDATFLGISTATGDSSTLVLRNPTTRPATASVQVWTEDGPAAMKGRSQIVVAPGAEEQVLLESVVGGHDAVGVRASVLGAPLSMHVQTTERDGLTPGGAEMLTPLPAAAVEQTMPGVDVAGTAPQLVLANPQGTDTTASVEVSGPDGVLDAASLEDVEIAAGAVVPLPLEGLADGSYSVTVRSADPVHAVTRSSATGADLPGDTLGAPVDFTIVSPASALVSAGVLALPAEGGAGSLTLTAAEASGVTIVPLAADGSAGKPLEVEVAKGASVTVPDSSLRIDGARPSALSVVPDVPGAVHAGWMQREGDGAGGLLLSALPVTTAQQTTDPLTIRVQD